MSITDRRGTPAIRPALDHRQPGQSNGVELDQVGRRLDYDALDAVRQQQLPMPSATPAAPHRSGIDTSASVYP